MPVSPRKLDHPLVNVLGFERRPGRHQIYVLKIAGRQVVRTLISHGVREMEDDLMGVIARQMRISLPQLKGFLAGEITREDYYKHLRDL